MSTSFLQKSASIANCTDFQIVVGNLYSQLQPLVGAKVQKAMAEEGISPSEMAEKLGVSLSSVYRYQAGENLTLDMLYRIADLCHQSVVYFLPNPAEEGIVAEAEEEAWQKDKVRVELVRLIKEFVRDPEADDEAIRALLSNVKVFRRKIGKPK
jgi:transcriptional regulator with XRE-family HTH domain